MAAGNAFGSGQAINIPEQNPMMNNNQTENSILSQSWGGNPFMAEQQNVLTNPTVSMMTKMPSTISFTEPGSITSTDSNPNPFGAIDTLDSAAPNVNNKNSAESSSSELKNPTTDEFMAILERNSR